MLSRANRADSIALQLDFLNKASITRKDLSRVFSFVTVENAYVCASWIGLDICTDTTRRTFSLNHDKRFLLHTLGDYPQRHRVSPPSSPWRSKYRAILLFPLCPGSAIVERPANSKGTLMGENHVLVTTWTIYLQQRISTIKVFEIRLTVRWFSEVNYALEDSDNCRQEDAAKPATSFSPPTPSLFTMSHTLPMQISSADIVNLEHPTEPRSWFSVLPVLRADALSRFTWCTARKSTKLHN